MHLEKHYRQLLIYFISFLAAFPVTKKYDPAGDYLASKSFFVPVRKDSSFPDVRHTKEFSYSGTHTDYLEAFKELAVILLNSLQRDNIVPIPQHITVQDITIIDSDISRFIEGGTEDRIWFTFSVKGSGESGEDKKFWVKSSRYGTKDNLVSQVLALLGNRTVPVWLIWENFDPYDSFYVSPFIGEKDLEKIDTGELMDPKTAEMIGSSQAEAFVASLRDRSLSNIRAVYEKGKICAVVNIDFSSALYTNIAPDTETLDILTALANKARLADFSESRIDSILVKPFLTGFEKRMQEIQELYQKEKTGLERKLLDINGGKEVLERINVNLPSLMKDLENLVYKAKIIRSPILKNHSNVIEIAA